MERGRVEPTIGDSVHTWTDGIKLFADCGSLAQIEDLASHHLVQGFTTNPTLMRQAGVVNYEEFGRAAASIAGTLPLSLEVFADDLETMRKQAEAIATWGENVYIKIPVTTTEGTSTAPLVRALATEGVRVNVTAIMTLRQVAEMTEALAGGAPSVVSVFAGRIADTGIDPVPHMAAAAAITAVAKSVELLWASPREILNLVQAKSCGADIITMTPDLWMKVGSLGRSLEGFSLETVKMFHRDADHAGYAL
jgi:transaldolase